ncbi:MAG: hypothetical protein N2504_03350 [candidate division WOR-3 bacterium]|nr:hypothetical protein [candidate division WOR-3 bacterium]
MKILSLLSLAIVDSSNFSFSRPINIKIHKDKIYILEITGNLWVLDNLKANPILSVRNLNQPSYDIEFIEETIFIAHEGTISKFYNKKLEHVITNLPKYEPTSTIELTKDTMDNLYIAVSDAIYKYKSNHIKIVAMGFYEPLSLTIDKEGKLWGIFKINENDIGIFPVYENVNYKNIEPIIRFNYGEEPTTLIKQKERFLVSLKSGTILEYSNFKETFKRRVIFKDSNIEISDFEIHKDYFYILDFRGGKIYKLK